MYDFIWRDWNCFLTSVATDGKDGRELKLEKVGPTFSSLNALPAKVTNKSVVIDAS